MLSVIGFSSLACVSHVFPTQRVKSVVSRSSYSLPHNTVAYMPKPQLIIIWAYNNDKTWDFVKIDFATMYIVKQIKKCFKTWTAIIFMQVYYRLN